MRCSQPPKCCSLHATHRRPPARIMHGEGDCDDQRERHDDDRQHFPQRHRHIRRVVLAARARKRCVASARAAAEPKHATPRLERRGKQQGVLRYSRAPIGAPKSARTVHKPCLAEERAAALGRRGIAGGRHRANTRGGAARQGSVRLDLTAASSILLWLGGAAWPIGYCGYGTESTWHPGRRSPNRWSGGSTSSCFHSSPARWYTHNKPAARAPRPALPAPCSTARIADLPVVS